MRIIPQHLPYVPLYILSPSLSSFPFISFYLVHQTHHQFYNIFLPGSITMTSVVKIEGGQSLANDFQDLSFKDQGETRNEEEIPRVGFGNHGGICAICLEQIVLQETALVKGCEHAYCVTCILRWASYSQNVACPQCKHPFDFLNVHRSLDGSIGDYMFEESVCLLLRASWFKLLKEGSNIEDHADQEDVYEDIEDYYEDVDGDLDDVYYDSSSNFRIGNRRWGNNGYIRAGRQAARPVHLPNFQDSEASSSREPKKKDSGRGTTGRRAKRALKREAADKAAEAKHQQHLLRLGRK